MSLVLEEAEPGYLTVIFSRGHHIYLIYNVAAA
jgi:hypothetical protein